MADFNFSLLCFKMLNFALTSVNFSYIYLLSYHKHDESQANTYPSDR